MLDVCVLRVQENLKEEKIEEGLESLQKIVEGYIEIPFISEKLFKENIDMVINEEGKLIGLLPSIVVVNNGIVVDMIMGNVIFTSHDMYGQTISLTPEQKVVVNKELKRGIFNYGSEQMILYYIEI